MQWHSMLNTILNFGVNTNPNIKLQRWRDDGQEVSLHYIQQGDGSERERSIDSYDLQYLLHQKNHIEF